MWLVQKPLVLTSFPSESCHAFPSAARFAFSPEKLQQILTRKVLFPGALQLLLAAFTCEYLAGFAFASSFGKQQLTLTMVLVLMLASSTPGVVLPFLPAVALCCPV